MLTVDDVKRVAQLARLTISDEDAQTMTAQLTDIMSLVDQLSQVNTDAVEPMVHAIDLVNVLAADQVMPSLDRELALRNAPSKDGECFRVPAVLG